MDYRVRTDRRWGRQSGGEHAGGQFLRPCVWWRRALPHRGSAGGRSLARAAYRGPGIRGDTDSHGKPAGAFVNDSTAGAAPTAIGYASVWIVASDLGATAHQDQALQAPDDATSST